MTSSRYNTFRYFCNTIIKYYFIIIIWCFCTICNFGLMVRVLFTIPGLRGCHISKITLSFTTLLPFWLYGTYL